MKRRAFCLFCWAARRLLYNFAMKRPDFDVALAYWENLLKERSVSPDLKWIFHENMFHVRDEATENFKLVFETKINPVTLDDVRRVYNQAKLDKGPIVFYMLVEAQEFSVCTLLGDTLTTSSDVFLEEWGLYFFAEDFYLSFEEINSPVRWVNAKALQWNRLSELDYVFCLDWFRKNSNRAA